MQELSDLLGEDLARFVEENDLDFIPGWRKRPDNLQRVLFYSMMVIGPNTRFKIKYYPGLRFLKWNLFDRVEIPGDLNSHYKTLAERIGRLMSSLGSAYHQDFEYLSRKYRQK